MYVYSRTARLAPGRTREAMAWGVAITEKVNQIGELEVSLWTPVLSPGVGTLIWSALAEDLEEIEATQAKLMVDDGFVAEVDRGAAFSDGQGADDALMQVVHGEADRARRPQYASVTTSQLAPGHLAKGVEVGIEIAQRAEQLSGFSAMFCIGTTGPYGTVAWISGADSLREIEAGEQAVNSDPGFIELVDSRGSQAFVAAATAQRILRRVV